ncbi:MAG: sulfatase-like hydrolase/transferase [Verrucomicrobiota bacterium]
MRHAIFLLPLVLALTAKAEKKPNFVFIVADDLGYADVGVHGSKDIKTPHIDSLAATGVRFTSGYSNHSVCSPMRAGFLTGRYQHRFGYETNVPYDPRNPHLGMPDDVVTIPQRMQKAGYATAAIGKWHLGAHPTKHPNHRGFDFFYGFLGGGHDYFTVDFREKDDEGYRGALLRNGTPETFQGYLTDRLSDEAVKWIAANKEKPFYLYLAYNAPHSPLQAPEEKIAQFSKIEDGRRRTYAAMVSSMDDGIGRVLKTLEETGLRENTVVAFLSDNGGAGKANSSSNLPLRGQKGSFHEGGVRMPFVVSWPARFPKGKVDDRPVIALDLPVTAVHLAGAPTDGPLDGKDITPFLTSQAKDEPIHEALFWRMTLSRRTGYAIRAGNMKLTATSGDGAAHELHNLATDPNEEKPLDSPADLARLQTLWDAWNKDNIPPAFPGFGAYHPQLDAFHREIHESMKPKK